ncbi:hypothetical protein Gpo141_00001354 [Globisporangium polare]
MTLYLAVVDLGAKVAQERLDPALSLFLFFVAFQCSATIIRGLPALVTVLSDKTLRDYQMGVVDTIEDLAKITPMRLWNVHPIGATEAAFTFAAIAPLLLSLGLIFVLVIAIKLRRRWLLVRQQRTSAVGPLESSRNSSEGVQSESGSTTNLFATIPGMPPVTPPATGVATAAKPTRFETATGVELAHRFGLRCNYDNLRTIKGLKFVSADGIYSNGFVIANAKYLVSTEDVLAILLMKLLRFRYRNLYVYDVEGGHSVQQMARLVFPDTLTLNDLLNLNITTLA